MANKILKTLNFGGNDIYDLSPAWENIRNLPFGYETPTGGDTLKWDGNTTGLTNVLGVLFHVSDATPTVSTGTIGISSNGSVQTTQFTEANVVDNGEGVKYIIANDVAMAVIVPTDGITVEGLKFNKAGIYLRKSGSEYVSVLTIKDCEDFTGVKTLDYKYLPKSLRFGSDGVKTVEILPLTELEYSEDMDCCPYYNAIVGVEVGKTYTVNYNGVDYECVGQNIDGICLGNLSSYGLLGNDEPFIVAVSPPDMGVGMVVIPLDGATSVTLSISYNGEVITPIQTKYLPEHLQFGSTVEYGEIMSERELVGGGDDFFIAMNDNGDMPFDCPPLINGGRYTVVYNGVPYETSCMYAEGMYLFGNFGLMTGTGDTGEPFIGMRALEGGMPFLMAISTDGSTSITMSLSGDIEKVTKLDTKYLPEQFIVTFVHEGNDVWSFDKSYAEIVEAYMSGSQVVAKDLAAGYSMSLTCFDDLNVTFIAFTTGGHLRHYHIDGYDNVLTVKEYYLDKLL